MAPKKADQKLAMKNPGTSMAANCKHQRIDHQPKKPQSEERERQGKDFKNESDGRVDEADDDRRDQCGAETAYLDAGKNIGDDHQTRGADKPVDSRFTIMNFKLSKQAGTETMAVAAKSLLWLEWNAKMSSFK